MSRLVMMGVVAVVFVVSECWTGVCVLGDGGGVGRLNLSGLLLLRGEGLCREDRNSK